MNMKIGALIAYTASNLGTVEHVTATKFAEPIVTTGDLGIYNGPHPNPELAAKDWHVTMPLYADDTRLFCVVHAAQFEASRYGDVAAALADNAKPRRKPRARRNSPSGTGLEDLLRF